VRWSPACEIVNWCDCSVVGYSSDSNDAGTEAEESPLLGYVTGKRLVNVVL
jgi:hypothetical protein